MSIRVTIIGAPASGKSTLTDGILAADPAVRSFGVRSHFHFQVQARTPIGLEAEAVVNGGGWIPDELVAKAVRQEFADGNLGEQFVFEGMPGNRRQAELLDEVLEDVGLPLIGAIHVNTPEEVCLQRAAGRTVCVRCDGGAHQARSDPRDPSICANCGGPITRRDADDPSYVVQRLELHRRQTPELVDFYRGPRLLELDGRGSAPELLAQALAWIAERNAVPGVGR
ncbi:adenylate kinase family protein [Streptomyces sp. MI02-7b]|uniref:adenylate kinase family protein n=1 Tax=Streptomyces sp. MI02-7b TaxID=462941 RepID=UPI0029A67DCA|nr:nucleoside monophosphate kinase [Streptomyces sp. MI02-7b]MDX3078378.1 nucleoside monophosphate kinase [Streptomyces sp. MI02-7b]